MAREFRDWGGLFFAALVVCAALLFLVGLGRRDLWGPDETRVAGIGVAMARTGDALVPRLNGEPFLEKPPLSFWLLSASFRLLGESPTAARAPSALAAICAVAVLFFLARRMGFPPAAAFLSGFILATSFEYWSVGRRCIVDMLLCLFTTSAMASFYCANGPSSPRRWAPGLFFILSLSGAVMTKGFVGLAVPLSALFIWLLLDRNFSFRAWLLLAAGGALCLVPLCVWGWFLGHELGSGAAREVLWLNSVGRFTGSSREHMSSFSYYFLEFPPQFLPWTLFLPLAFVYYRGHSRDPVWRSASLFLIAWFAVPFILLSLSAGKRGTYILPLYPAAALLVGTALYGAMERGRASTRWLSVPSALTAIAIVIVPLAFFGMCVYFRRPPAECLLVLLPGLSLGVWAFRRLASGDTRGYFTVLAASLVVLFLTFDVAVTPLLNPRNSYGTLFSSCRSAAPEEGHLALFEPKERLIGAAVYYRGGEVPVLRGREALMEFLGRDEKNAAVARKKHIGDIEGLLAIEQNGFEVDSHDYVIVRGRKHE